MSRFFLLLLTFSLLAQAYAQSKTQIITTRQGLLWFSGSSFNVNSCVNIVTTAMRGLNYQIVYTETGTNGSTGSVQARTPRKLMVTAVCNKPDKEIFMAVFGKGDVRSTVDQTLVELGDEITAVVAARK